MKRKVEDLEERMADLDVKMDDIITLCRTPPVPRRHPHRQFYQYRSPLPPSPAEACQHQVETELVPRPLLNRSMTLPAEVMHFATVVKSPSPLFSRSNTLPPASARNICVSPVEKSPSPLFSRRKTLPPGSTRNMRVRPEEESPSPLFSRSNTLPPGSARRHVAPVEKIPSPFGSKSRTLPPGSARCIHVSPVGKCRSPLSNEVHVASLEKSPSPLFSRRKTSPPETPAATIERGPTPLFKRTTLPPETPAAIIERGPTPLFKRRTTLPSETQTVTMERSPTPLFKRRTTLPPEATQFATVGPSWPSLSPVISNSSTSSPAPSLCFSDASISSTPLSTPATSPHSSPKLSMRPLTYHFAPSVWTIPPATPVPGIRQSLRRKKSPRIETLRGLRAKDSEACLQKVYTQRTSAYMDGSMFAGKLLPSGFRMVLESPGEEGFHRRTWM
ncbi:hypothetical protein EJ02DRAFT_509357 [Clathrospora elynae]|uniref:Uncharacterized protein n=1 Tax=Clathrospora elynae TaxID=706981 RepID=A0A6A5T4M2_9PLEO|nr:hypothetical protein EJ02DRAFT_509357 [Clathrospora elynae]